MKTKATRALACNSKKYVWNSKPLCSSNLHI